MNGATLIGLLSRSIGAAHVFIYRRTGGRIGARWFGGDILLLTARGRRSGVQRTTPLMFFRDGADLIVVAGGRLDRPPDWCLNLRARPEGAVQIKQDRFPVRAEEVADHERARLWPLAPRILQGYRRYEQRSSRRIPLVRLRRVGATNPAHEPPLSTNAAP